MFARYLAIQLGRTVKELFDTMDSHEFEEHLHDYVEARKPVENETTTPRSETPADAETLRGIFGA